jgi:diguanylate cyclase (GGDEF)-like protein
VRVVRRASLIFSVTMIVAIGVGYFARKAEIAHERDVLLAAAADVGAADMSAIVTAVELAAATGTDPETTAEALASVHPELGVCVVIEDPASCDGSRPEPSSSLVGDHARSADQGSGQRAGQPDRSRAEIETYESVITIVADGPELAVIVQAPLDVIDPGGAISVWATTFLPSGSSPNRFVVEDGVRQTATPLGAVPGVFVVAATEDSVPVPAAEQRFYLVVFGLAVTLLALTGATMLMDQRNLLERASFDPLTKLPNRGEFQRKAAEALAVAERQETGVCLLLFDLNGFKLVNDTYGHHAGDEMLQVVGARLRKAVRGGDTVARWGGDEFVVLMPGIADDEMGLKRAGQLAEQVAGRTRLDSVPEPLRVKVSVGVSIFPRHGTDLAEMMESADSAMYEAKRTGVMVRVSEPIPDAKSYHSSGQRVLV